MEYLQVRNFEKFQHYKDRRPPWIKLYADLLDDDRFFELSDAERYHLIGLFILASQHDNKIPNKPDWLKHQLRTSKAISLQRLIDTGWVSLMAQDASGVPAECLQDASPRARAERREEKRREETEACLEFGEFHRVHLTQEQHGKLTAKLNGCLDGYMADFDRWVNEAPDAKASGVKRKDRHAYETILTWFSRDVKLGKVKVPKSTELKVVL